MKVISIHQPWAWAVIFGGKDVENRTRNLFRSVEPGTLLAIHASKTVSIEGLINQNVQHAWEKFRREVPAPNAVGALRADSLFLDQGRIIGVVQAVGSHHARDCVRTISEQNYRDPDPIEFVHHCSKWAERGSWHLELGKPRSLTVPLKHVGAQGVRDLPASVEREVLARLAA